MKNSIKTTDQRIEEFHRQMDRATIGLIIGVVGGLCMIAYLISVTTG